MYDSNEKCWRSLGSRQDRLVKRHDTAELVERRLAIMKQLLRYITYARRQTAIAGGLFSRAMIIGGAAELMALGKRS